MDEAEQLCDRLVVMDRGKIVAEGSPRDLIERYATREVVELRFDDGSRPDDLTLLDRRARLVASSRSRTACCSYADDGDAASHRRARARARAREPCWSGGARSRTSSSTSRAGASSNDSVASRSGHSSSSSRSTSVCWRGTAVTSVVTPVVYLLALGVGLGVFVDRSTNLLDGITYLETSRPGSWPRRQCSSRRSRRPSGASPRSNGIGSTTRCWRARCACETSCSAIRPSSRSDSY